MTYMTPFEKYQSDKTVKEKAKEEKRTTPILKWADEIISHAEPRAKQESPLKIWWLSQQEKKDVDQGV